MHIYALHSALQFEHSISIIQIRMPSIIRKTTSSPCVCTSNIITNTRRILYIIHIASTARTVAPDGYWRGRWTPKGKEPSQDHSSIEIPEEPARYSQTCPPTHPCTDGRAGPPR